MKNLFFLFAFLFIVSFLGCSKKATVDPPVEVKYTVEVIALDTNGTISPSGKIEVVSGNSLKIDDIPKPGFALDIFKVDGFPVIVSGNSHTLPNIQKNSKVEISHKKTLSWYLMDKPWVQDSIIIRREDKVTWDHYATTSQDKDSVIFLPTGRFEIYRGTKLIGNGPWSVNESSTPPTLNWGGTIQEIEKLDENSLILAKYDVQNIDPNVTTLGAVRLTYSHH